MEGLGLMELTFSMMSFVFFPLVTQPTDFCAYLSKLGFTGELVRSAVRRLHLHFLTLFDILNPKMIHVAEISCQIRLG